MTTRETYHYDPTKTPLDERHEGSFAACVKIGCCLFREQLEAEYVNFINGGDPPNLYPPGTFEDLLLGHAPERAPYGHVGTDPDVPFELHDGAFADCPGCIAYRARNQRNSDPLPRYTPPEPKPYGDPPSVTAWWARDNATADRLDAQDRAWLLAVRRAYRRKLARRALLVLVAAAGAAVTYREFDRHVRVDLGVQLFTRRMIRQAGIGIGRGR